MEESKLEYYRHYRKERSKEIKLRFTLEDYEIIKRAAEQQGVPVATFIKSAIYEKLK